MPSTRYAGMLISLNMSPAENTQLSFLGIEKKIVLDLRLLNVLNALDQNIVLRKLVALPPISTPSMWKTQKLITYSMITLGIIVSMKYLHNIQISFEVRKDQGGTPSDNRRHYKPSGPDQGTIPNIRFLLLHF